MDHLANYRVEQAGLSTANLADNDDELSLLNLQIDLLYIQNVVKAARLDRNVIYFVPRWA